MLLLLLASPCFSLVLGNPRHCNRLELESDLPAEDLVFET